MDHTMLRKVSGLDGARWIIYLLLSLLTIAAGAICLLADQDAVGTSLLAGGTASMLFLAQKVIDDISVSGRQREIDAAFSTAAERSDKLERHIRRIAGDLSAVRSRVSGGADERCIQGRHLTEESKDEVAKVDDDQLLKIDAIGISLKQMLSDHSELLKTRPLIQARLIVLDPNCPSFDMNVAQEGRNPTTMRTQILQTIERVKEIEAQRAAANLSQGVTLRLLSGAMTTTGIRVGKTWFFRPRFQDEANSHRFFFERYDSTAPGCFGMIEAHFQSIWEDGTNLS